MENKSPKLSVLSAGHSFFNYDQLQKLYTLMYFIVLCSVLHQIFEFLWQLFLGPHSGEEASKALHQIRFATEERKGVQIPNLVQSPASPARIATDTSAQRLGSLAISAPTLPTSDSKSWSSPAKDEHHYIKCMFGLVLTFCLAPLHMDSFTG